MAEIEEISMNPWMMASYKAANLSAVEPGERMQGVMEESISCATVDGVISKMLQDMVRDGNEFMRSCELTAQESTADYYVADNDSATVIDGVLSQ
ncbi:hypothetical protein [Nocardia sp. NRRL S-836]|uniref:hypothetical protein n=1 Tax=Nocardia sp. NRRL S-836 TaxID=1519492 RepID=UPI0006AEC803|nr:hypothetical protein [Nocardia sp. NRRL S-836]KOV87230.1 hypothetical protein ADL03_07785 [Nocardia sp. NRRL S-836]